MSKAIKIRSIYDPSEDPGIDCTVDSATGKKIPSLTKQADKEACDINKILERYNRTGQLPDLILEDPRYGDFSSVPTFQEAFEIVARAEAQFSALDARVRDRFTNDPVAMLAFCNDPANFEEMVKLGLALPRPAQTEPNSPAAPPAQPAPPQAAGGQPATAGTGSQK